MKVQFDIKERKDRELLLNAITSGNEYFTYTSKGLSFVGYSTDEYIIRRSYIDNTIWAYNSIQWFYNMAHKYYEIDDSKLKYFFDIGANIGTTCISFYKKFDLQSKIIAFEPVKDNFRMLRINALLNNLPDDSYCFVNKALGAKSVKGKINYSGNNTGAANVSYLEKRTASKEVDGITDFDTLDDYVASQKIDPKTIKYLWIDTEGFEPEVIKGAENTLSDANIPIFMEFTPFYYNTRVHTELSDFVELLAKYYSKYIVNGTNVLHDIRELVDTPEKKEESIVQFDILLIK